ncbi:carcinoembryonic antigen-related cell adhesion molecule 1-like isoform X1 [Ursus maritimus]|uniref:Carcinoembryonic antigen-related cell adhesion molecule 1-like isoform X1 n=1 Tax=Ursus maritimus TaxID=29073 RepID=A0A8M1GDC6_URSMA|nr:carcinoembryonic antigen-related cell adhesion molecule 1-like isoform X1 [Ursus maritimus]XP_040490004.1 carcinoembryonic antigen-related cell adhesion molecule 1-like isoform X1 [Ursus maritimus]XP_040490005.1 carcinoembryonic antigen-related cell adhesion molecule 1-like isoform X1 [Ursus maritimus]
METEAISLLPSPPLPGSADPPWAQERERRHHPHIMGSQPGWASAEAAFLGVTWAFIVLIKFHRPLSTEGGRKPDLQDQTAVSTVFLEQKLFSQREGQSRQQAPWSSPRPLPDEDMSPWQELLLAVDTQVTIPGPAHSGRETIYPNGSLLFQRVTLNDTGYYTLQIVRRDTQVEQGTGQIRVFLELPKPNITSNNSDPVENEDSVVLTCEPQTQSTSYLWSVNRKSLPASARLELSLDNRTLTIHRVTRNDTGPLQCETRNPVSAGRSDPFTLNVL